MTSFSQWFIGGLLLAGLFWAVVLGLVFLFAVYVFIGPLALLAVIVLALLLLAGVTLALSHTKAGSKERQTVSDELRSGGKSFEDVQKESVGRLRGLYVDEDSRGWR